MSGRVDSASRIVAAPPDAVYRAFIDPEALIAWLPPAGMRGKMLAFDPRPGGVYRIALTYETPGQGTGKTSADTDVVEGRFVELIPGRRIVQEAVFESDDPAFAGTMRMTWRFERAPQGTNVAIRCEQVPPGISKADHDEGLASSLDNLAAFVEARGA